MLVTIFAPANVHLLEIAGIRDALFEANCRMQPAEPYRVRLVTERGAPEESASGTTFIPDASVGEATQPFSRVFRSELGITPTAYIELIRVDIARRLLEDSTVPIKTVAHTAGFGSAATLRRALLRKIGVTPLEYRLRFQSTDSKNARVWCNRYGQRRERLPGRPDREIRLLSELPVLVGA